MKVSIFVPTGKRGKKGELILTDKLIGDFEVAEPIYSELKQLGLLADKRFDIETDLEKGIPVIKSVKVITEGFVAFYSKVLELSEISEKDIVKYGFANADVALDQIYLAWTKDEKKS